MWTSHLHRTQHHRGLERTFVARTHTRVRNFAFYLVAFGRAPHLPSDVQERFTAAQMGHMNALIVSS